jgi:hypothetical protein
MFSVFSSRRSPERRVANEDEQLIRLQSTEAIGERQQIDQDVSCRGPGTIENSTHIAVVDIADLRNLAVAQARTFVRLAQSV